MIRRSLSPALVPLLAALLLLAACDGPTSSSSRLMVEAVEGNAQEGLPGELLPFDIGARVTDGAGVPVAGAAVTFQAAAGAGTVQARSGVTDGSGMAWAAWQLPPQAGAPLSATAEAAGAAEPARFTAHWLPRERTDLLLTNTTAHVRLLLYPGGAVNPAAAFQRGFVDSLAFVPFARVDDYREAVAFTYGLPPAVRTNVRWTPGRDTLRLDFAPRVQVPLTFWIIRGPYEDVRARMELQLIGARAVWETAGVEFPDVRWVDATGHPDAVWYQEETPACGAPQLIWHDAGRTNVYVAGTPVRAGLPYAGFACGAGLVYLTSANTVSMLLAHELGHTFDLPHQSSAQNVMNTNEAAYGLTAGQIFRVHASAASGIHVLYGDRAVVPARTCPVVQPTCLDLEFDM